jgi:hypothetical protein
MSTATLDSRQMLEELRKMRPEEFDAFFEQALLLRQKRPKGVLSADETELVQRINRGLPPKLEARFDRLTSKRRRSRLTPSERKELLSITDVAETLDAERALALAELAKLRKIPIRVLMAEMGIKAPAIHG